MNLRTIIICILSALVITSGIFYFVMLERKDTASQNPVPQSHSVTEGVFVPEGLD